MSAARPVTDGEADELLAPLAAYRLVVLAVSGGADSMALMSLTAAWAERHSGSAPAIVVATVDHRLRPEAAAEARHVAQAARALGLKHETLVWNGDKPASGLQDAARQARYALLAALARRHGQEPVAVVTAHTEDDQAETLLMRLARGSGLDGLAAIRPSRRLIQSPPLDLLRPLLPVPKQRLVDTLMAAGVSWMEDPSNDRFEFERVRLRAAREMLAGIGLSSDKLALSASRLSRANDAVAACAGQLFDDAVRCDGGIYASLSIPALTAAPLELALRVLARVLPAFGGEAKPATLQQQEALLAAIRSGVFAGQTLGGCELQPNEGVIDVWREAGRLPSIEIQLDPGQAALYDRRFEVSLEARPGARRLSVRPLGRAGFAALKPALKSRLHLPAAAALALPSFWQDTRLVAVPSLAAWLAEGRLGGVPDEIACKARFIGLDSSPVE